MPWKSHRTGRPRTSIWLHVAALLGAFVLMGDPAGAEPLALQQSNFLAGDDSSTTQGRRIGRLDYLGGLVLTADHAQFGGLSGLTYEPDSKALVAVSDRGRLFSATIIQDIDGRLRRLADAQLSPILDTAGQALKYHSYGSDAEAIYRRRDGSYVISFERIHRLLHYPGFAALTSAADRQQKLPARIANGAMNGGIEALAELADSRLFIVSERNRAENGDTPAWYWQAATGYQPIAYPSFAAFRPTDAALLPNGDLLVLERRFNLLGGLGARIRRIAAQAIENQGDLRGQEIARIEPPFAWQNFEGLAVQDFDRETVLLYLLSDDNFTAILKTVLLQFRLPK